MKTFFLIIPGYQTHFRNDYIVERCKTKFNTLEDANEAALKLSKQYVGTEFNVMKCVNVAIAENKLVSIA